MVTGKHNSFKEIFKNDIKKTLSQNTSDITKTYNFFAEYDDYVYSLNFYFEINMNDNKIIIKIYDIGWQEEYLKGSLHNVCGTKNKENNYLLYDYTNDIIIKDAYLSDKYGDCSDGWFSSRIDTIFENYPRISK